MAGGGVKGGTAYGATDEFGARAVENRVHVHDLHATILALLGFDHTKLTYRYNGRDFRLTDNFGNVVQGHHRLAHDTWRRRARPSLALSRSETAVGASPHHRQDVLRLLG